MVFESGAMAEGYARARPPLHPLLVERMVQLLGLAAPVETALDVGCGAGLSTAALSGVARRRIGLDAVERMAGAAAAVSPGCGFAVGAAERLPVRTGSVDLITAAGSLNWVELPLFFGEAARVLRSGGVLGVYDFGHGREFADSDELGRWNEEFYSRYPSPPARALNPDTLRQEASGFSLYAGEDFAISLTLAPAFYLEYTLTETNVADAIGRGAAPEAIRGWCRDGIERAFGGRAREVVFRGYIACLSPRRGTS